VDDDVREAPGGPRPAEIRFFGTTWLAHDGGYRWRRAGLALGALLATGAGAFALRFGFQGVADARAGGFVTFLAGAGFTLGGAVAFRRTWRGFSARLPSADPGAERSERSAQGVLVIGFLGVSLAYFFRCFWEAPGEGVCRSAYEAARSARRFP
jgi:hypothetical protein